MSKDTIVGFFISGRKHSSAAPGAKVAQHDSEIDPDPALVQFPGATFTDAVKAKTTVTVTSAPAKIEAEFEHV
jgi:hypothetical protein